MTIQVPNSAPAAAAVVAPVITNGQITSVNVINGGSGYAFAPIISFADPIGTGATAIATLNASGTITAVKVTNPGSNYSSAAAVVLNAPPPVSFTGKVVTLNGSTMYQFTTTDPSQSSQFFNVYSPFTPYPGDPASSLATWQVFANAGVFADNTLQFSPGTNYGQAQILGNIENQLVSAMNRGVATEPYSVWTNGPYYAAASTANWYAAFLHQDTITIDGNAYGFAFDDQGGNSTDLSVNNPKVLTITLSSWKNASPLN